MRQLLHCRRLRKDMNRKRSKTALLPNRTSRPATRILFLVNDAYTNTLKTVYLLARSSPDFIVRVAATDSVERSYSPEVSKAAVSKVLSAGGIEHQVGISTANIESFRPDWIFVSRPYDDYAEPHLLSSKLSKHGKLAHLSYGSVLRRWQGEYACLAENPWLQKATAFFVSSPLEFPHDPKFVPVGQLKLDEYINFDRPIRKTDAPCIAWKPRWTVASESSLKKFLDVFSRVAQSGWEVRFVLHPMMLRSIDQTDQKELGNRLRAFLEMDGVRLVQGPNFLDEVLGADIFVGDTCSTLAEFVWTAKPIVWTNPPLSELNELGVQVLSGAYNCFSPEALLSILRRYFEEGVDSLASSRRALYDKLFTGAEGPLANNVLSYLRQ
jgi:hypothetical protein